MDQVQYNQLTIPEIKREQNLNSILSKQELILKKYRKIKLGAILYSSGVRIWS